MFYENIDIVRNRFVLKLLAADFYDHNVTMVMCSTFKRLHDFLVVARTIALNTPNSETPAVKLD